MKEKTSITLSSEVLAKLDSLVGQNGSRSAVIESIVKQYLRERTRREVQARDLDRLNKAADRLNAEAADVLGYQFGDE
jgi:metal-responsive CopG/Arc/MetJ family transcriptional regulator